MQGIKQSANANAEEQSDETPDGTAKMAAPVWPLLKSGRLSISPLRAQDATIVATLTNDPAITDVVHFLSSPFTVSDALALIGTIDDRNCFYGAWRGDDLVGVIGVHARGDDQIEIGYWIGSRFQRQGFASVAVSTLVGELRQRNADWRIVAECRQGNTASWNLLHKLGFRATGGDGHRPGRKLLMLA